MGHQLYLMNWHWKTGMIQLPLKPHGNVVHLLALDVVVEPGLDAFQRRLGGLMEERPSQITRHDGCIWEGALKRDRQIGAWNRQQVHRGWEHDAGFHERSTGIWKTMVENCWTTVETLLGSAAVLTASDSNNKLSLWWDILWWDNVLWQNLKTEPQTQELFPGSQKWHPKWWRPYKSVCHCCSGLIAQEIKRSLHPTCPTSYFLYQSETIGSKSHTFSALLQLGVFNFPSESPSGEWLSVQVHQHNPHEILTDTLRFHWGTFHSSLHLGTCQKTEYSGSLQGEQ